ncbi:3',5'-cyclic-nucleotide phosphodiesterase [Holophaga foetida]|uniref:3',5'-cyclic-nucleotide phosphodiesterase n=1 Tax=Holophaga foetida TaxID=35839 RepID=UPI00024753B9|nr:3',5'-cyclic-nucleotide phosphodiesterase [Holophaga foetida]
MELRVLGCSGGEAGGERLTGLLVNGTVAIDAGSLTQALSVTEQVGIRHIFLTHSHLDHICSLPFYTKNVFGHTEAPVAIRALPETLDVLRRHLFNDELWPDFSVIPSRDNPIICYSEIGPEKAYEVEGLRITPIAVNHLVPCVGYLVEDDHSAFIFTSDTAETDRIYEVANATPNLRLFITEVSFPNRQKKLAEASRHLTADKLKGELGKLNPGVPVAIYHLTPGDKPTILPELEALGDPRIRLLHQDERIQL